MEEFDRIAVERKNYEATPEERRYCQGGGSNTKRTEEHPDTNNLYSGKRKIWQEHPQNPMQKSGYRGHHGHDLLHPGLPDGNILYHNHGDCHHNLPSTLQKTSTRRLGVVRQHSESGLFEKKKTLRVASRRMTLRTGGVHRNPLPRAMFQRFCFQPLLDALRILSQHFCGSKSDCQNNVI